MKSLFIRCSEETYNLAHALAKKENRSLNKQIIHMIHSLADKKNLEVNEDVTEWDAMNVSIGNKSETKLGLRGIAQTKKQGSSD
jgi:hypothetical protein|tara:strand:+ start:547 stop:798 length:252 start_codon:yes stop_codon:yes gene_type:complete